MVFARLTISCQKAVIGSLGYILCKGNQLLIFVIRSITLTEPFRNARAKRKESRSSLTPHASIVRELIPFHTFRFAVHWPTPQVTPSDEWRNLFTNMYAIDLWRVDADYRRYLCTLTLTQMRVIAAQKLSSVFTPDGFDLVPPTIAPVAFKLDAKDEEKLRETTEILARPYVRLCLPYFIWFGTICFNN